MLKTPVFHKKPREQNTAWDDCAAEIKRIEQQMRLNEQLFDMTDDFDLTDYAIYQRIALQKRYRYLIRQMKAAASTGWEELPPLETVEVN